MKTVIHTMLVAMVISGCARVAPVEFGAEHPASPEAAEGRRVARVTSLRADEATRKTEALLTAARKEQKRWESAGQGREADGAAPENKNQTEQTHEHP